MRRFLLAAAATLLAAATPAGAQDDLSGLMSPQEIAAFRADWNNWSHCAALGAFLSFISEDPQDKADYKNWAQAAGDAGTGLARAQGVDAAAFRAEAERYLQWAHENAGQMAETLGAQVVQCHVTGIFAGEQPAPQTAAVPAASVPLGYTIALSVNGRGGAVTYARTAVPGQLAGRWSLIDGSIKGEETATRTGGAAADGSLAGSYTTSGISNGSRYTGRLSMTARGTAAGGAIRLYDLAWDNGDRGFGVEEGPWLHIVYGAAATGLITPSRDGGGWELIWVGPEGEGIAAGKVFWRGSLTGTHMADDPDAGTSFPIEVTETAPGTLRVILPGGFAGIALKAG